MLAVKPAVFPQHRPSRAAGRSPDARGYEHRETTLSPRTGDMAPVRNRSQRSLRLRRAAALPRFFISYSPELPDPSFAKNHRTDENALARDRLKLRLRERIAQGCTGGEAPGHSRGSDRMNTSPSPSASWDRIMTSFRASPLRFRRSCAPTAHTRQVNQDSGERAATLHFALRPAASAADWSYTAEAAQQLHSCSPV